MYVGFWVNFERPSGGKKRGRPLPAMLVTSCIHKRCTLVYIHKLYFGYLKIMPWPYTLFWLRSKALALFTKEIR